MFRLLRILLFSPVFISLSTFSVPYTPEYVGFHSGDNDDSGKQDSDSSNLDFSNSTNTNHSIIYSEYQLILDKDFIHHQSPDIFSEKSSYVEEGTLEKNSYVEESHSDSRDLSEVQYPSGFARLTTINVPEPASALLTIIGGLALLLSRRIRAVK